MNVAKNKTNKALILFLVSLFLLMVFVFYSEFKGDKTPLISEFVILKNGVQFEENFTIEKDCSYWIRLHLYPNGKQEKSIPFNNKELLPADIQIDLYRHGNTGDSLIDTMMLERPKIVGLAQGNIKLFTMSHISMDEGNYKLSIRILRLSNELFGSKIKLSVDFLPNWKC